ncbi:MAG TPA: c-type cytochrome [Gemmatimonadaceae bacterium]|nr:c-type cytochrome [Gemmatimonadaceae bacterium]
MKSALLVAVGSFVVSGCTQTSVSTPAPVQGTAATVGPAAGVAPGAAATSPGPTPEQIAARNDSLVKDRTMHVNEVLAQIAGKEQMPAEQVYKNIQMFKGMPAQRLLAIMNRGFSNSLGVSCSHCHVVGEYDKEDKPTKQIARDMSGMVATINGTLLKNIKNLKSTDPTINCGTCHNGRARPGAGNAAMRSGTP